MIFDFQTAPAMQRLLSSVTLLQRIIASQWDFMLVYSGDGSYICGSLSYRTWLEHYRDGTDRPIEEMMKAKVCNEFIHALRNAGEHSSPKENEWLLDCDHVVARWIQSTIMPLSEEGGEYVLVLCKDITEQKQYEHSLITMAYQDPLTGLPNRRGLQQHFQHLVAYSRRYQFTFAMLALDLDDFKAVNDSFGHQGGDEMLKHFVRKVSASLRDSDIIARVGGDEFVVLLANIPSGDELMTVIRRIYRHLQDGMTLSGRHLPISVSIGAAMFPVHGEAFDALMKKTDEALYQVKGEKKNTFAIYGL